MRKQSRLSCLILALVAGCGTEVATLIPASGPAMTATVEKQTRSIDGVRVTILSGNWPGAQDIRTHVTPLRVMVENQSDRSVRFRFADLTLVTPDGGRYQALPLPAIGGSVERETVVSLPGFYGSGFVVSPFYAPYYPGYGAYAGPFGAPWGYEQLGVVWNKVELPTPQMIQRGIPEGVIQPGGHIDGYVYFERVPEDAGSAQLVASLRTDKGAVLGRFEVPFVVRPERIGRREVR